MCLCAHVCVCIRACVRACVCACVRAYVRTCGVRTYVRTCNHLCIQFVAVFSSSAQLIVIFFPLSTSRRQVCLGLPLFLIPLGLQVSECEGLSGGSGSLYCMPVSYQPIFFSFRFPSLVFKCRALCFTLSAFISHL